MNFADPVQLIIGGLLVVMIGFVIWMAFALRPVPYRPRPLTWQDIEYMKRMEIETSMRAYRDAKRNVEAERNGPDIVEAG